MTKIENLMQLKPPLICLQSDSAPVNNTHLKTKVEDLNAYNYLLCTSNAIYNITVFYINEKLNIRDGTI